MNTLNLNAYGVSEMTKQEMMETDGGALPAVIIIWKVGKFLIKCVAVGVAIHGAVSCAEDASKGLACGNW